jgi:hypothetical protein
MREQLYYHLSKDLGIMAIVDTRIYPQRVPTGQPLPYLEFSFIDRVSSYDQDGYDGYNQVRVDIECNAATLGEAVQLGKAVFDSLNLQNVLFGEFGNQEELCSTTLETEIDNQALFDGSEDGVRVISQTYKINYLEA